MPNESETRAVILSCTGRKIELFTGQPGSPLIIHTTDMNEGTELWKNCAERGCPSFHLAVVNDISWNQDLSPWEIPPIRKGEDPYTGGADRYLAQITEEILPLLLDTLGEAPASCALSGYSLAGLFALYAAYRTDRFAGIVSASGSLWYPGFLKFAMENPLSSNVERIYLSIGDKEKKTRNPVMAPVEDNTRQLAEYCRAPGRSVTFELNPGNHFQDPVGRTARGIYWILSNGTL